MSEGQVQYEISLKDLASGPLQAMTKHAEGFEKRLDQLKETGLRTMESLGIGFATFQGWEFIKGGVEEVKKLNQQTAMLKAGLESTGHAAGISFEDIKKSTDEMFEKFEYSKGELMKMQSLLVTFPAITKQNFGEASQMIIDMSARFGHSLEESSIQVGKALQDPIKGITALHRAGVNFSEVQKQMITHLVKTGHTLDAQKIILRELGTEFRNSAQAAADADPLLRFNKIMEDLKENVGEAATELLTSLTPVLEDIAGKFRDAWNWAKQHKDVLEEFAKISGAVLLAFGAYKVIITGIAIYTKMTAFWSGIMAMGIGVAGDAAATASGPMLLFQGTMEGINRAFRTSPVGATITAIVLIGTAVYECWQHLKWFRQAVMAIWETLKAWVEFIVMGPIRVLKGLGEMIEGALTFSPSKIGQGMTDIGDAVYQGAKSIGDAWQKGWKEGAESWDKDHLLPTDAPFTHMNLVMPKKTPVAPTPDTTGKGLGSKASGTKVTTINMKIMKLVGIENYNATTIHEQGLHKLKEAVSGVLESALMDSQIVAGV